ncbi:MAG: hypothetical protein LBQ66_15100, partial [Planctomycetaceae bacterium]|nr:hypothetical protein [Planctomycetaceae bacterium]
MYCKNYSWFFGLFLVFLFLVIGGGCSAISRCEPCLPVESGSAWKMTRTKSKQSAEFDNNEQKNLASNPD